MSDLLQRDGWLLDLFVVAQLAVITSVVLLGVDAPQAVLWLLGVPFLLFLPGYAIVAALFPEEPAASTWKTPTAPWDGNPDWTVRLALSIVLSAIVVAGAGVVIDWVAGIRLLPAVVAIGGVTLAGVAVALLRRLRLPPKVRANPFAGRSLGTLSMGSGLQNLTLAVAVLALVGSVAFVGAVPTQGEAFTESYLLTENAEGDLVADDYPTEFVAGEGQPLHLDIENNEFRPVTYEVAVVVQEVDADGTVVAQQRIDRFAVDLAHGESTVVERDIAPTMTGEGLRLQFQIYKGTEPADAASPDQTLQLWIDVDETGE
ncbi:DUF1616 domain-containing protein [Natronomonas halophila]|uniref:DUF1616 domain-containing protein n=1 Tax=Natronomonas halophila TaxID=2747817 RepID=UPI0015B6D884|nr:DUF1616 domain-containing protein [Natronomonas halophila]QLD87119.1 DUF1616 domain-containing protein [Natronomonas halophila]